MQNRAKFVPGWFWKGCCCYLQSGSFLTSGGIFWHKEHNAHSACWHLHLPIIYSAPDHKVPTCILPHWDYRNTCTCWGWQICLNCASLFEHISSPLQAPDATAARLSLYKITMAPAILGIWSSRLPKFKWSSKGQGKLGLDQHMKYKGPSKFHLYTISFSILDPTELWHTIILKPYRNWWRSLVIYFRFNLFPGVKNGVCTVNFRERKNVQKP